MPQRLSRRLFHLLLIGPRWVGPPLYDLYAHVVLPRARLTKTVFANLAQAPDFLPHYLYLNLGHALAIDPSSARLFVAARDTCRFRTLREVDHCTCGPCGLGYRLQITFTDGTRWEARTLVSVEPLRTAEGLLAAALKRQADGVPPPAAAPAGIGDGFSRGG